MKITKYLAIGLAGLLAFTPIASLAGSDTVAKNNDKVVISEKEEAVDYIVYEGKITDISKDKWKNDMSIKVNGVDKLMRDTIIFHITEDMTILSEKSKAFLGRDDLKEGDEVTVYFKEDTPMTMSIPPQTTPDALVVNDNDEAGFVNVSHFNSELVDLKNELKLNISDDTLLIDANGNKVQEKDLENRDLMVFYTVSTRSIPAQTSPEKVLVLLDKEEKTEVEITVMDKVVINGKELELKHKIYKTDSGHYMFPVRPVAEALGYKVNWDNDERSATLTKDNQWSKVTIGKDDYNFAKMIVQLGQVPEIKRSKTYVPVKFLEEALQLNLEISDGILQVK